MQRSPIPSSFCLLHDLFYLDDSLPTIQCHTMCNRSGTMNSKSSKFTSTISVTKSLANHLNGKRLHGCAMDQVTPYIVEAIKGECSTKYCAGELKTEATMMECVMKRYSNPLQWMSRRIRTFHCAGCGPACSEHSSRHSSADHIVV